jgi:putative transposase
MPRIPRVAPGGFIYHVLNRSAAKFKMLRTEKDKQAFLTALLEASNRFERMKVLGWCVMENHWHLLLWPQADGDLARFMHWLTLAHAARWRTSHQTIGYGPVYQGRFRSFIVQDDSHYLTVLRYIERNALRAHLVERAEQWKWSSLHTRTQLDGDLKRILAQGPVEIGGKWIEHVNAAQTPAEEAAMAESIRRSRPYGNPAWQRRIIEKFDLQCCLRPPGRPRIKPK